MSPIRVSIPIYATGGMPSNSRMPTNPCMRRLQARDLRSTQSNRIVARLAGLLAVCQRASGDRFRRDDWRPLSAFGGTASRAPRDVLRSMGARSLQFGDAPQLHAILRNICSRVSLWRTPEMFVLPTSGMNAFALGNPDDACISVTRELLRRLGPAELEGILAHEVAHVVDGDTASLEWAETVRTEIARLAGRGIAELTSQRSAFGSIGPQSLLFSAAPMMARMLVSALSRTRELSADAHARDVVGNPGPLVAALCKLEQFHSGLSPLHAHLIRDEFAQILHTHPGTWERISHLT